MIENTQKPEPPIKSTGDVLEVHSVWDTIQGEGPSAGMPATFIRLAGCNLQCVFCDTEYTEGRQSLSISSLMEQVEALPRRRLVVITGGEPFRQNLNGLITFLVESGRQVQIETNGILPPSRGFCYHRNDVQIICCPKTSKVDADLARRTHSFKYVVKAGSVDLEDGLPTVGVGGDRYGRPARPPGFKPTWQVCTNQIFLQPLDEQDEEKNKANQRAAVESCLKFGYRFTPQIHKMVGLP